MKYYYIPSISADLPTSRLEIYNFSYKMLTTQGQFFTPALYLYPLNGSFVAKYIYLQDNRRVEIGRQVDEMTVANRFNGYFDANALSKQHAEIWEANRKVSKFTAFLKIA